MWSREQTYQFVGLDGIGVSSVARVLHQQGVRVQGSDVRESQLTEMLRGLGIPVTIGHAAENAIKTSRTEYHRCVGGMTSLRDMLTRMYVENDQTAH